MQRSGVVPLLLCLTAPAAAAAALCVPQRLVERWGPDIEAQLDRRDAVKYLTQCQGISGAKATKIKAAWDATKGGWAGGAGGWAWLRL